MSFLKNFGHNVVPIFGGLIPFNIYDADSIKEVQGITLKNVNVSLIIENEKIYMEKYESSNNRWRTCPE